MEITDQFHRERNHSQNTIKNYDRSIRYYETVTGHSIKECLEIAETEENNNINWKNTKTRKWLLEYRDYLYQKYNVSSAQTYLIAIITFYRHFEINIPRLPYYSTKGLKHSAPINYQDLPDREILTECLKVSNPLIRALILFMSSSGVSRIDVLNLTIGDYLDATSDYHDRQDSVKYAVKKMNETDVIPMFTLSRQKTGQPYFTFCSHEACKAINDYILTRKDKLTRDQPLFKINKRYINTVFERLNDYFDLGKVGNYNRLRPHMLRKYHASQLAAAGMGTDHINLLQGRKVQGIAHQSYIRLNPETLKNEYIQALPFIVIEDVNQYRTENELLKEENKQLKESDDKLNSILSRLEALENERPSWDEFIKGD